MTAQAHDTVVWHDADHLLVGVSGHGLFNPVDHGLFMIPTTTANWRGCIVRYGIPDDRLLLLELHDIGLHPDRHPTPPEILGVAARAPGG